MNERHDSCPHGTHGRERPPISTRLEVGRARPWAGWTADPRTVGSLQGPGEAALFQGPGSFTGWIKGAQLLTWAKLPGLTEFPLLFPLYPSLLKILQWEVRLKRLEGDAIYKRHIIMSGDVFKALVMLFLTMSTWLTSYMIWVLQATSHWRVCYCYICSWRFCLFSGNPASKAF